MGTNCAPLVADLFGITQFLFSSHACICIKLAVLKHNSPPIYDGPNVRQ